MSKILLAGAGLSLALSGLPCQAAETGKAAPEAAASAVPRPLAASAPTASAPAASGVPMASVPAHVPPNSRSGKFAACRREAADKGLRGPAFKEAMEACLK